MREASSLRSTLVTTKLPVEPCRATMDDPTLADAVLDRLCMTAHRITLKGPSMRKRHPLPINEAGRDD